MGKREPGRVEWGRETGKDELYERRIYVLLKKNERK